MSVSFSDPQLEKKIKNASPDEFVFVLLAGTTAVSARPGISAAGASPELMSATPVVDSEIIMEGKCLSMSDPPMTPEGIPTPSIVTRASLNMAGIKSIIVDAGLERIPKIPYIHSGIGKANDPAFEQALPNFYSALKLGEYLGSIIDGKYRYVVVGESIPGGTTTSYLVLRALGFNMMTSSSLPDNPEWMKRNLWREAKKRRPEVRQPEEAASEFGDYSMPVSLGIAESARNSDLILAGGTQMATCSYLIQTMKHRIPYLCTTSWVMKDSGENIKKLVPGKYLVTSEIKMDGSRHEGLRMYERGHVKEGAGMGAAFMLASSLNGDEARIYGAVDKLYEDLS